MTRDEFIDKWKLQSGKGCGSALFDCSERLGKDLDELLKQVNLTMPDVRLLLPYQHKEDGQYCLSQQELSIFIQGGSLKESADMYGQAISLLIQKKFGNEA